MAMTLVSTVTVGSGGAASIEFTNIPQTGKDLLLLVNARHNSSGSGSVYINNDTTSGNYSARQLFGNGSTASSNTVQGIFVEVNFNTDTANTFSNAQVYFSNYTSTTNKSVSVDSVRENNATAALARILAATYTSSSGITSLTLSTGNTLEQHSTASLYLIS